MDCRWNRQGTSHFSPWCNDRWLIRRFLIRHDPNGRHANGSVSESLQGGSALPSRSRFQWGNQDQWSATFWGFAMGQQRCFCMGISWRNYDQITWSLGYEIWDINERHVEQDMGYIYIYVGIYNHQYDGCENGTPSCLTLGADPKRSVTRNNFGDASKWMMLTSYFLYKMDIFADFPIISYLFWDCYTSVGFPPGCETEDSIGVQHVLGLFRHCGQAKARTPMYWGWFQSDPFTMIIIIWSCGSNLPSYGWSLVQ